MECNWHTDLAGWGGVRKVGRPRSENGSLVVKSLNIVRIVLQSVFDFEGWGKKGGT